MSISEYHVHLTLYLSHFTTITIILHIYVLKLWLRLFLASDPQSQNCDCKANNNNNNNNNNKSQVKEVDYGRFEEQTTNKVTVTNSLCLQKCLNTSLKMYSYWMALETRRQLRHGISGSGRLDGGGHYT